jgi:hypothetical protein
MKPLLLATIVVLISVAAFTAPAIPQDPAFHVMADQHPLFGFPSSGCQSVSGHTLKHLATAAGVGCVWAMLRDRGRR